MNYLPFVSWGVFGAETARIAANRFASYGLVGHTSQTVVVDSGDVFIGGLIFSISSLIKRFGGKYSLFSVSGKKIKDFKNKPTDKQIDKARKENGYK